MADNNNNVNNTVDSFITDYIVIGTLTTTVVAPIYFGIVNHSLICAFILCVASVVMVYKHQDNLVRIKNGTEIGLRKGGRGVHRVKK